MEPASSTTPQPLRGCFLGTAILGVLLALAVVAGFAYLLYEMSLEAEGQGFGISPPAIRAFQEAQKSHPNTHLLLKGYYPTGGLQYINAEISDKFDPKRHRKLQIRGVSLVVENGVFELRHGRPYILHRGDDPTTGYQVKFRNAR